MYEDEPPAGSGAVLYFTLVANFAAFSRHPEHEPPCTNLDIFCNTWSDTFISFAGRHSQQGSASVCNLTRVEIPAEEEEGEKKNESLVQVQVQPKNANRLNKCDLDKEVLRLEEKQNQGDSKVLIFAKLSNQLSFWIFKQVEPQYLVCYLFAFLGRVEPVAKEAKQLSLWESQDKAQQISQVELVANIAKIISSIMIPTTIVSTDITDNTHHHQNIILLILILIII